MILKIIKNKLIRFIVLLAIIFSFSIIKCSNKKNNILKKPGFKHFKIFLKQSGIRKEINNHEVQILRKPFSIEILFTKPDGIFVNASFDHESFIPALENKPVNEIPGFKGTIIAEELLNKEQILNISKGLPNFWNYTNENDHRFNEVIKKDGIYYCTRIVSNLVNNDNNNEKVKIEDTKAESINMVFMKFVWNQDYSAKIEKKRYLIKLKFIDEKK